MTKKGFIKYLVFAFGIAWILQVIACILYLNGNYSAYQVILSVSMFVPLLAVILSGNSIKNLGWKTKLKGNWKWVFLAWLGPSIIGALGAVIYFLIFPSRFDLSGEYLIAQGGETFVTSLEASGMSMTTYLISQISASIITAPLFNMVFAVGEEAGWRGTMYPYLQDKLGYQKGTILGGVIWGIWHWPLMLLVGYEYGTAYWGAPVLGMLLFCVITTAMGVLFDYLYKKTHNIWIPTLAHGAINAFAGIPLLFLKVAYFDQLTLGPAMVGIIGGLPLIMVAVWILSGKISKEKGKVS